MVVNEVPPTIWRSYASRLADDLRTAGFVDGAWSESFAAVPRHHFITLEHVPAHGRWRRDGPPVDLVGLSGWLAHIYSPYRAVVTAVSEPDPWGRRQVTTESPPPALAGRTLDALDIRGGMRLLELGTGSGHMTALLANRMGEGAVTSVDIDPDQCDLAGRLLGDLGLHPELHCRDGGQSGADQRVYDRIVVGYTIDDVPAWWTRQLREGGLLVARLGWELGGGRHIVLRRASGGSDAAHGRFLDWTGSVPAHRRPARAGARRCRPYVDGGRVRSGTTFVEPAALAADTPAGLLAQSHLGPDVGLNVRRGDDGTPGTVRISGHGSWAELSARPERPGRWGWREGGPARLMRALESAMSQYADLRRPGWPEFGVTAQDGRCRLWHGDPYSGPTWPLPPSGGVQW